MRHRELKPAVRNGLRIFDICVYTYFLYHPQMQKVLAIAVAIPFLLVATALLGFIKLATFEAISSWGVSEAFAEITGAIWNISVFVGCWVIGLASLYAGLSLILSSAGRATTN
jgi:hypothetical protein